MYFLLSDDITHIQLPSVKVQNGYLQSYTIKSPTTIDIVAPPDCLPHGQRRSHLSPPLSPNYDLPTILIRSAPLGERARAAAGPSRATRAPCRARDAAGRP